MSEDQTKVFIEPGEEFDVIYGNGKRATVICLAGSKKRELGKMLTRITKAEASGNPVEALEAVDTVFEALQMVMPNATEDFLETIDEEFASQIVFRAFGKQAVGDSDRKKSE